MSRDTIIECLKAHAQGMIAKHRANVEIYLSNPVGIGEHSDVMEAIEIELDSVAKYNDRLENEPREWRKFIKSLTHQVTPEEITRLKQLRRQYKQKIYNKELRKRKKEKEKQQSY